VFELTTLVVIGTDSTGSCKSNYHTMTTTPIYLIFWILYIQSNSISFFADILVLLSVWFNPTSLLHVQCSTDSLSIMTNHLAHQVKFTIQNIASSTEVTFKKYFSYIVAISFIGGVNRVLRENHRPVAGHWQTLSHNVVSSWTVFELTTLVVFY
jgi:hypothetical protein